LIGPESLITRAIYILVGLSAVYEIMTHKANCRQCDAGGGSSSPMGGGADVTHG